MQTIRIAIDAMGGDYGPRFAVEAAKQLAAADSAIQPVLYLHQDAYTENTRQVAGVDIGDLQLVLCPDVIEMCDKPAEVLRSKKQSTMFMALESVKAGDADVCVSAGNTGAYVAIAWQVLQMLPGFDRPVIASLLPVEGREDCEGSKALWLDLGANLDCKPALLLQFAQLGQALMKAMGKPQAIVSLLNIGTENSKGNKQIQKANELFAASCENYSGFIEPSMMYTHQSDIVVCDGLLGNIALKASEAAAGHILALLPEEQQKQLREQLAPEYNSGAFLLGLQCLAIKTHGNSQLQAWQSALEFAADAVRNDVVNKIKQNFLP